MLVELFQKWNPPNEPTPVLVHSLTDCEYSEKVHFTVKELSAFDIASSLNTLVDLQSSLKLIQKISCKFSDLWKPHT